MVKKILATLLIASLLITEMETASAKSTLEPEAFDTVAGYTTIVEIEDALSYENIEILVTKPNGSEIILETESDKDGEAKTEIDGYHLKIAGTYEICARYTNLDEDYSQTDSFRVYEDSISISKSTLEADSVTKEATGYDPVELTVALKDKYGNPIKGHTVEIISSRNEDYITPYDSNTTNSQGEVTFYAYSDEVGISIFTAYDTISNIVLNNRAKIAFFDSSTTLDKIGGDNYYASVLLASSAGTVDHLEIEDLESEAEINDLLNFTVTAYDISDAIVENYAGEVRFSSSDDNADLPDDYTFEADDQGSHTFSLNLRFTTSGTQTLTVTDIDNPNIEGEFEIEISSGGNGSSSTKDNSAITSDEFTLDTPQEGTYSSNTIEFKGNAPYGYTIEVYEEETIVDTIEIASDNTFEKDIELENGDHLLYFILKDSNGNEITETDPINLTVDTEAPSLDYIEISPEGDLETEDTFKITIFTEPDLSQVGIILNNKIYELTESIEQAGAYTGTAVAPDTEGAYNIDVLLVDNLANEMQYSKQAVINVLAKEKAPPAESAPSQVENVEAVNGDTKVTLTWERSTANTEGASIQKYKIYYGPSADLMLSTAETFDSSTVWYIPGLQNEVTYHFAITAIDSNGTESLTKSKTVSGTPEGTESENMLGELHNGAAKQEIPVEEAETPSETPDSGPGTAWILLFTLTFSQIYFKTKKIIVEKIREQA